MGELFIEPEHFKDIIVVGGGTCGLAVCARLCEQCPGSIYTEDEHQRFHWLKQRGYQVNLVNRNVSSNKSYKPNKHKYSQPYYTLNDIMVLDEVNDKFLGQWNNQFSACKIPYLRSPMFFHLDPVNIDGLVSYTHTTNRNHELMEIENVVGKEYSKHQLKKQMKKKSRKIPAPNEKDFSTHDASGLIDINMRDWKDYYRPSTSLFHDYCQDIINRYDLHNIVKKETVLDIKYTNIEIIGTNKSGKGFVVKTNKGTYGCKVCVLATGHRGKINYPIEPFSQNNDLSKCCHTSHIFTNQVSFPPTSMLKTKKPSSLVVVGGGLTSAQLVDLAIRQGVSKVYLLLRGPLKIKHFDFHLDWVTKYKNLKKSAFYIKDTDEERLEMIQDARQGGSINPEYRKKLLIHCKSGRLELMKHTVITSSNWNDQSKTWDIKVACKGDHGELTEPKTMYLNPEYIVFATGNTTDINQLPFLQTMTKEQGIKTVNGFPCITDNLEWKEGLPLFIIGKNASLKVGPSSANLDGARLGAERIGWYIQDQNRQGKYAWSDHNSLNKDDAETLDHQLNSESQPDSFATQLKLASGQLNWYSLLQSYT